jgi:hypothetical protein
MTWMKTADSNQLFKYPKEHRQMAGDNLIGFVYKNYPNKFITHRVLLRK